IYARCWFAKGDRDAKRMILSSLGSNLTLLNKKVAIKLDNPLLVAVQTTKKELPEISANSSSLEPKRDAVFTNQITQLQRKIPSLLWRWEDVRTYWKKSGKPASWKVYSEPPPDSLRLAA